MNIQWNPEEYTKNFDFVPNYGKDVLKLIDAPPGSYVVDLGCGNGALTQKLQEMGYRAEGVDDSGDMILCAGKLHPDIKFTQANALTFRLEEKADWIRMFVKAPFSGMSADLKDEIITEAIEKIRPKLLTEDGWMIDYVRIRVKARRK